MLRFHLLCLWCPVCVASFLPLCLSLDQAVYLLSFCSYLFLSLSLDLFFLFSLCFLFRFDALFFCFSVLVLSFVFFFFFSLFLCSSCFLLCVFVSVSVSLFVVSGVSRSKRSSKPSPLLQQRPIATRKIHIGCQGVAMGKIQSRRPLSLFKIAAS